MTSTTEVHRAPLLSTFSFCALFRYDCRGHLSDLTLWDSDLLRKRQLNKSEDPVHEEERRIEEECDQERYLELYRDVEKQAAQEGRTTIDLFVTMLFVRSLEEESKRLSADKNAYNQVGFKYDESNKSKEPSSKTAEGKVDDERQMLLCQEAFYDLLIPRVTQFFVSLL